MRSYIGFAVYRRIQHWFVFVEHNWFFFRRPSRSGETNNNAHYAIKSAYQFWRGEVIATSAIMHIIVDWESFVFVHVCECEHNARDAYVCICKAEHNESVLYTNEKIWITSSLLVLFAAP